MRSAPLIAAILCTITLAAGWMMPAVARQDVQTSDSSGLMPGMPDTHAPDPLEAPLEAPHLDTPRRAVHAFIYWQQRENNEPDHAAMTMARAAGADLEERIDLARKLLRVLDAKGLYVDYDRIPSEPAYRDSLSGRHQYVLFSSLPQIYLERDPSGAWLFSERTVEAIPELYRSTFSLFVDVVVDRLPDPLRTTWLGVELWQIIGLFVWILLGLVLMKLFDLLLEAYVLPLLRKTGSTWDDRAYEELERPLDFVFLFTFFRLTYSNLMLPVKVNHLLSNGLDIAVSVSVVWVLYKLANVASLYLDHLTAQTKSKLDDQLVPLLRKSMKVFVVAIGTLFILQNNGINVTSLLAGLGLGGLAFALAARDTLANFFGSVTIFVDKPFQIGDWVKAGSFEGTVEEVGFRSTRIRTFYNSVITVPNSKLADAEIDNLGMREYRRYKTTLNLTYDTTPEQMEAFVEGIKAIAKATPAIRQDYYEIHFEQFGAHSLDVLVYIFFKVPTWSEELQARHGFLLDVMRLAKQLGVEFAFPTQTLHVGSVLQGAHKAPEAKPPDQLAADVESFGPGGNRVAPGGVRIFRDGREIDYSAGTPAG